MIHFRSITTCFRLDANSIIRLELSITVLVEKESPNVGLEPTTVGLRVQRSTD